MNKIQIRRATPSDLDDMLRIYGVARQTMKDSGNPNQWGDNWPPYEVAQRYTQHNGWVVVNDDRVVACFGLFENADEQVYKDIQGKWLNDAPYAVIHTLGSDGTTKGIAHLVFEWAIDRCDNVRIDTHANNAPMLAVLKKDGWTYCGKIVLNDRNNNTDSARVSYQKMSLKN